MCIPGVFDPVGDLNEGRRQKQHYEAQARLQRISAHEAIRDAEFNVRTLFKQAAQDAGMARAAQSASTTDVTTGSSAAAQAMYARVAELDAYTIRNNAAREAWGYRTRGRFLKYAGALAELEARREALGGITKLVARSLGSGSAPGGADGGEG